MDNQNNDVNNMQNNQFNPNMGSVQGQNGETNQFINQDVNTAQANPNVNVGVNQGMPNNQMQNNSMPNSNNNLDSSSKKSFFQDNKMKLIIGGCAAVAVIVLLFIIFRGKGASISGYTAPKGDTLKVVGAVDKYNLSVTSSLEKFTVEEALFTNGGDIAKLGVNIENLGDSDLSLGFSLSLVDSSKNKLYDASFLYNGENNIASEKIKPGETKSGYIYFEGPSVYGESQSVIDLSKVKYLKVTTLSDAKKDSDGSITGHNAEYFLELQ